MIANSTDADSDRIQHCDVAKNLLRIEGNDEVPCFVRIEDTVIDALKWHLFQF